MKFSRSLFFCSVAVLAVAATAWAQGAPSVVWEVPGSTTFQSSVGAVGWSPGGGVVAAGNSDRNARLRNASNGALLMTLLQPSHSNGVFVLSFSTDGL